MRAVVAVVLFVSALHAGIWGVLQEKVPAALKSKGVITVGGKMVERLHLVQAKRTVAIANSVKEIEDWF